MLALALIAWDLLRSSEAAQPFIVRSSVLYVPYFLLDHDGACVLRMSLIR
jgi:hypothetical protein